MDPMGKPFEHRSCFFGLSSLEGRIEREQLGSSNRSYEKQQMATPTGFHKGGTPIAGWFMMEDPIKMHDFGVAPF